MLSLCKESCLLQQSVFNSRAIKGFPLPARFRHLGHLHPGGALAAAEVSWEVKPTGEMRCFPS